MNGQGTIVIRGGRLIDAKAHAATLADILIEGEEIREVGAPGLSAPEGARLIDAAGKALMPGLVNAHTHSQGVLGKAMADHWNLELLLNGGGWIIADRNHEDKYLSAQLGAVEMVLRGCTACYDLFNEFPFATLEGHAAVGRAYADIGIRATIAPMMGDITFYDSVPGLLDALPAPLRAEVEKIEAAPIEALAKAARQMLEEWPFDREQINIALAPTIPLLCSDDFLTLARDIAREHDALLHTHMAESRVQMASGLETYGTTLTAHFETLGLLSERFTAAHAVWITREDMKRLGGAGASVAHNPSSNMRLGSGLADVRPMVEAGVNVGIGTDAGNCGDHLNMFENMRLAAYTSRVKDHDNGDWLTTGEVFAMATEGSAKAMGFKGRLGRIAPDYKADIVFLDLKDVALVPLNDIVNQLVLCSNGSAVESVMVGGRMVVEGGRVVAIDTDKLMAAAEAARERLYAVRSERRKLADALEIPVATYCNGLARAYHHPH
jgi:guanine deaminase